MKILILTLSVILISAANAQSVLTLGAGTSKGVLTGADLCVNIINGPGIFYGGGTVCGGLVAIEPSALNELPVNFRLYQNYPNPFNPVTKIKFDIPAGFENSYVKLTVFNLLGEVVSSLMDQQMQPGSYEVDFDGSSLSSGTYLLKISAGNYTDTKKMVIIK
jgi:hypothetical protein